MKNLHVVLSKILQKIVLLARGERSRLAVWGSAFHNWAYVNKRLCLKLAFAVVLVPFLISRIPFFLYYPAPFVQPDTASYWISIWQMEAGEWPSFSYRTPGYPLFAYFVFKSICPSLLLLIFMQNLIALAAALLMVYCVHRRFPVLSLFAAAAMAAFQFSSQQLSADFAPLTESLCSSYLVIAFALVMYSLYNRSLAGHILASVFMALSIAVRPTCQFLIVTYIMILVFLAINRGRYSWKQIIAFAVPFPLLLMTWLTYNFCTFGKFKLTSGLDLTLICGVSMYLEESEDFSKELNDAIRQVASRVSAEDRRIIRSPSWNISSMRRIYYKCDYWNISKILTPFRSEDIPEAEKGIDWIYREVAMNSIRKNGHVFTKAYIMNLYLFFFKNLSHKPNIYNHQLPYFYDLLYLKKDYASNLPEHQRRIILREYYDPQPLSTFKIVRTGEGPKDHKIKVIKYPLTKFHKALSIPYYGIFRISPVWSLTAILLCIVSGLLVLRSRFKSTNTFYLLVLTSGVIGHAMICSIFSNEPRFSVPTAFTYYLAVALLPILFYEDPIHLSDKERMEEKKENAENKSCSA